MEKVMYVLINNHNEYLCRKTLLLGLAGTRYYTSKDITEAVHFKSEEDAKYGNKDAGVNYKIQQCIIN